MAITYRTDRGTISNIIELAGPKFVLIAVGLPVAGFLAATIFEWFTLLKYVHVITGALWTGIDTFIAFVLGPILVGMQPEQKARIYRQLSPRLVAFLPVIGLIALVTGVQVAARFGMMVLTYPGIVATLAFEYPWITAAIIVGAMVFAMGFGVLLPTQLSIIKQVSPEIPNLAEMTRLAKRNARNVRVQAILQIILIFIMAALRF